MLKHCTGSFGGVDILINNAGIGFFGKTVEETSSAEIRQTLETNLFGTFYACHHAIPYFKKRGGGYIINISSLAGQNPHPRMAAYNASKFALNGFTEALMQEVRQDDIKVSYICPGSVNTAFGGDSVSDEKVWQLQPSDIAAVVLRSAADGSSITAEQGRDQAQQAARQVKLFCVRRLTASTSSDSTNGLVKYSETPSSAAFSRCFVLPLELMKTNGMFRKCSSAFTLAAS